MEYRGRYQVFDPSQIRTYPISERNNKVSKDDLLDPEWTLSETFEVEQRVENNVQTLAQSLVELRRKGLPVILFTGAHLIKNGLGLLLRDLVRRDLITCVAGNMATAIHDFELALIGETSEYVPQALEKGQFGMAYEFAYINAALQFGHARLLGLGESLGNMILDNDFRSQVLRSVKRHNSPAVFQYPEISVLASCIEQHLPFTVHTGIGTDVTDQHPSFDGAAKGGCSGRDFLIYVKEIEKLAEGGMILNIGSAVTGPEVFLKAASMTGNIGLTPMELLTADFDIRPFERKHIDDEASTGYYFRDQKSIVVRVPEAYGGKGVYIQGNQRKTFPLFYQKIREALNT